MDWQNEISIDPTVCHGQPCFTGTRVLVHVILANLAAGVSEERILVDYPSITPTAIRAAIAYAADLAQEPVITLPA